jgi:hypothetical protein
MSRPLRVSSDANVLDESSLPRDPFQVDLLWRAQQRSVGIRGMDRSCGANFWCEETSNDANAVAGTMRLI